MVGVNSDPAAIPLHWDSPHTPRAMHLLRLEHPLDEGGWSILREESPLRLFRRRVRVCGHAFQEIDDPSEPAVPGITVRTVTFVPLVRPVKPRDIASCPVFVVP